MTVTCYPLDAVTGSPEYTGRMLRETISALVGGASTARPLGAFSGVRPGTPSTTVALAGFNWTCEPHSGILDVQAAAEAGPYFYAVTADETGTLNAAHASLVRTDLLVATLSDPAESDGTSIPRVQIVYVPGTAGAGTPATPTRSMALARFNVPQSGGGSPTVTWVAPTLFAAGAKPVVATQATLTDLSAVAFEGMEAAVLATPGATWRYTSSAWVMHGIPRFADAAARTAAITTPAAGMKSYQIDKGTTEEYFTTALGVASNGWFPVLGQMPAFDVTSTGGTAQTPAGGWVVIPSAQWPTPNLNTGFTSWTSGVLTVAQTGWYECSLGVGTVTKASAERIGAQINKNSATPDTNPILKGIGYGRSGFAIRNLVKLVAGDALRFHIYQDTSSQILADVTTFASVRYVRAA